MLFHLEGKAEFMRTGKEGIGHWEYDKVSQILKTIKIKEIVAHKVITITEKELKLSEVGEEDGIIVMKKKLSN